MRAAALGGIAGFEGTACGGCGRWPGTRGLNGRQPPEGAASAASSSGVHGPCGKSSPPKPLLHKLLRRGCNACPDPPHGPYPQIGTASCSVNVCQSVYISMVAVY